MSPRFAALSAALATSFLHAQSPDPAIAFEVASIKAAPPPDGRGMTVSSSGGPGSKDPGRWTTQNWNLANLVSLAYNLNRYDYSGPDWMDTARFNISAKVPEGATKDQLRTMVENLLVERFKMKAHRENREMAGYDLVVGKNGAKLTEAVEDPPPDAQPPRAPGALGALKMDGDGFPELPPGRDSTMIVMNGRARMRRHNSTMTDLASQMSFQLAKPVHDATGLAAKYDYVLFWSMGPARVPASSESGALPAPPEDTGPNLFNALQQQLGLKLEARKVTVSVLVVDHMERVPTEN